MANITTEQISQIVAAAVQQALAGQQKMSAQAFQPQEKRYSVPKQNGYQPAKKQAYQYQSAYAPKTSFGGEQIVGTVKFASAFPTAKGNGVMAMFTSPTRNYRVYVKNSWTNLLNAEKEYAVTLHIGKVSGKPSHAICIGPKARVYAGAEKKAK